MNIPEMIFMIDLNSAFHRHIDHQQQNLQVIPLYPLYKGRIVTLCKFKAIHMFIIISFYSTIRQIIFLYLPMLTPAIKLNKPDKTIQIYPILHQQTHNCELLTEGGGSQRLSGIAATKTLNKHHK